MTVGSFAPTDPVQGFAGKITEILRRLGVLELALASKPKPTTFTSGFSIATGWTLSFATGWRIGALAGVSVIVTRTGGTITPAATGDITNTAVITVPTGMQGSISVAQSMASNSTGRVAAGFINASSGLITLAAVGTAANIVNTDQISLGGVYICA